MASRIVPLPLSLSSSRRTLESLSGDEWAVDGGGGCDVEERVDEDDVVDEAVEGDARAPRAATADGGLAEGSQVSTIAKRLGSWTGSTMSGHSMGTLESGLRCERQARQTARQVRLSRIGKASMTFKKSSGDKGGRGEMEEGDGGVDEPEEMVAAEDVIDMCAAASTGVLLLDSSPAVESPWGCETALDVIVAPENGAAAPC